MTLGIVIAALAQFVALGIIGHTVASINTKLSEFIQEVERDTKLPPKIPDTF